LSLVGPLLLAVLAFGGTSAAILIGASQLAPGSRWYVNPILHTIVSAGVAIAVLVVLSRWHRRLATFDRIDMVSTGYAEGRSAVGYRARVDRRGRVR
jgi:membrane protein implicated in regulation of membrane protease activity